MACCVYNADWPAPVGDDTGGDGYRDCFDEGQKEWKGEQQKRGERRGRAWGGCFFGRGTGFLYVSNGGRNQIGLERLWICMYVESEVGKINKERARLYFGVTVAWGSSLRDFVGKL